MANGSPSAGLYPTISLFTAPSLRHWMLENSSQVGNPSSMNSTSNVRHRGTPTRSPMPCGQHYKTIGKETGLIIRYNVINYNIIHGNIPDIHYNVIQIKTGSQVHAMSTVYRGYKTGTMAPTKQKAAIYPEKESDKRDSRNYIKA